jgi:PAS domain S-box-containing protein
MTRDAFEPRGAAISELGSERLFRALTEHSAEATCLLDAHGIIRYANPEFCRVFGYRRDEALGLPSFDLVHPDDVPTMVAKFEQLARVPGAVVRAEYRARLAGGGWGVRSVVAQNLLSDPTVAGIVVNGRDVTEQRRAERALRASEARYRQLVETSHDGICTVDDAGAITYANRRLAEMLGYPMLELAGRPIFDFMAPEAVRDARTRFARRQRGRSEVAELPLVRGDGTTLWAREVASPLFAADGTFTGTMYILGDVTEWRRAEETLRESDRLHRLLFDRNPLPMFVADAESRRILAVNDAAVASYGYARAEFLAMRLEDIRPPEDREAFVDAYAGATGYVRAGGLRHRRKDGSLIDVEVVTDDVVAGDHRARLVIARDVTAQRRATAVLRDAHQEMATLVDALPVAVLTVDRAGRIRSWNAMAERIFGWTAAEVIGHDNPVVPPAQHAEYEARLRRNQEAGLTVRALERPALRKDGTVVDIELSTAPLRSADGTVVGEVAIVVDITARREAEAALRETRRQMELLLASAGEGILAVDGLGRVTFVNPAAARLLGSESERLLGRQIHPLIHHSHPDGTPYDEDDCPVNASIRDGTVHRVDTEVFWREDRTSFPVEYVSTPIREEGRIVGAVLTFQDITQRRQLELQLRQAQKMEAIGQLAGGVAHDFNNLLTVITGYTAMLLTELPPEDPVVPDLREIQSATERAAGLTRQLLAFSRRQVLAPRVIDLRRVVGDMERMLCRLIGEDVELSIAGGHAPARVHADPGQLEQVVMNLAVNARDAMPAGGRLTIEVEEAALTHADAERFRYVIPGEYVRLCVRDTGLGMDEETRARLFEPFFTTKEPGEGTGLGLATVYGIVKQSGGYIWVDSAPGEGATFRIYLPHATEELEGEPVDAAAVSLPEPRGATVLLAEDEGALRAIVERILTKRGYRVLAASGGAEALALAERHDGPIDLLVTDVVMPLMSGQELAHRLVRRRGDVPVLFLTGYSMEAVANHGVLRPGSELLKKPFSPQELAVAVSELLLRTHVGLTHTGEHAALRAPAAEEER